MNGFQGEESSGEGGGLMTCDEMAAECAEYQKKLDDKLQKDLPGKLAKFMEENGINLDDCLGDIEEPSLVINGNTNGPSSNINGFVETELSEILRPMAPEEMTSDFAPQYQQKHYEMMQKQLPTKYINENGIDQNTEERRPVVNGFTNKPNGSDEEYNNNQDLQRLLMVREREAKRLEEERNQLRRNCELLEGKLDLTSMERDRAITALDDTQKRLLTIQNQVTELIEEKNQLLDNEVTLKNQLHLQILNVQDKDKLIKILENGSYENRRVVEIEKLMEKKDEDHKAQTKNLYDQLELSLKKCRAFEMEVLEKVKKVRCLEEEKSELVKEKDSVEMMLKRQIEQLKERLVMNDLKSGISEREAALLMELNNLKEKMKNASIYEEEKLRCTKCVQTEPWSMDTYNAQYLKYHETKMSELESGLNARHKIELEHQEQLMEKLREENENIKRLYLETHDVDVDVHQLQEELATSKQRILALNQSHSQLCQPKIDAQEEEIKILKIEIDSLSSKSASLLKENNNLTEKLNNVQDKYNKLILELENQKTELLNQIEISDQQKEQLERLTREDKMSENVATSPIRSSVKSSATSPVGKVPVSTATTSPVEKMMSQSEVMRMLHGLAIKHEHERIQYESCIEDLRMQILEQQTPHHIPKQMNDAATVTDPMENLKEEALEILWQKMDDVLTARTVNMNRVVEERDVQISSLKEDLQALTDRSHCLREEYAQVVDKYNQIRIKANQYREQVKKKMMEMKEEWQSERKRWTKERETLEANGVKREKALLEVQESLRNLQTMRCFETVESVVKMYDDQIASLKSVKRP